MANQQSLLRQINDIMRRLLALEVINQSGILTFGDIVLDGVNGIITVGENQEITLDGANKRIVWTDGTDNRITIDGNGNLKISTAGNNVLTQADADLALFFNPLTNDLTIKGDPVNTNSEIFSHLSVEHFFTGSDSYIDRTGAFFKINGDNFVNQSVIFESVMAVEQNGRTAYCKIYNVTDGQDLAGAVLTTTASDITNPAVVRSSPLTFPSGLKQYKLQIAQVAAGNGGDNAHFYAARLVITQG